VQRLKCKDPSVLLIRNWQIWQGSWEQIKVDASDAGDRELGYPEHVSFGETPPNGRVNWATPVQRVHFFHVLCWAVRHASAATSV